MTRRRTVLVMVGAVALLSLGWATGLISLPWTHDLDYQISIKPQEMPIQPPEGVVPVTGKIEDGVRENANALVNSVPADSTSLRRGELAFGTWCRPCHGAGGEGDGKTALYLPIPPIDLTRADLQDQRTDGSIYYTIRHGNVIMPGYAYALSPERTWDLVNYVRTLKKP